MIVREIDWRAPLAAFAPLAETPWAALLHAGEKAADPGWSIIAAVPATTLEARGGDAFVDGARSSPAPFEALAALHGRRRLCANRAGAEIAAPFLTGLVGFVGYEMGALLEPAAAGPASPFLLPDMAFAAYDAAALFDRRNRRAFIAARERAAGEELEARLGGDDRDAGAPEFSGPQSNFTADGYRAMVARVIEQIRDGVLFQANVAQQLRAEGGAKARPFDVFRRLAADDSPFGAFLHYKDGTVVSDSPERFLKISPAPAGARIIAEPVKGTRPRGKDAAQDAALAEELKRDAKERAENIMIADLTRNDLSRICRDGSIREEAICALSTSAHVHHLVSRIAGVMREGLTPVDALAALFPCGSITGAPKIEAMKTIAALEGAGRGPYCGAIGYIGDDGAADFSVAIRTMIIERRGWRARATFPVGGGVTLRSDPAAEYRETLVKARGALAALGLDEEAFG